MNAALLIGLAVTVAAPAPKEPPKTQEAPGIVGSWNLEKAELGGMVVPIATIGELALAFGADGVVVAMQGKGKAENSRYSHDPKKSPAEIDIVESKPGAKEMTVKGIYKIDGDTLMLCMTPAGERPTKFESPAGGQTIIMTFKRTKKD